MQLFETLTYAGQRRRLRHLVDIVLPHYNINIHDAKVALLQYEDNAIYRLTTCSEEQYILRVSAAEGYTVAEQLSEMQWLLALRHETALLVPEPVQTVGGK